MEQEDDINKELGDELRILINEIRNGKVKHSKIRRMAQKMNPDVYGVYVQNEKKNDDQVYIFYLMLDEWYKCELYLTEVNSRERLYSILKEPDIKLNYIVQQMEDSSDSSQWIDTYNDNNDDPPQSSPNEQSKCCYFIFLSLPQ